MNKLIDDVYHPHRMTEDFLAHYIVEKATGLPDEVILKKAIKYYCKKR